MIKRAVFLVIAAIAFLLLYRPPGQAPSAPEIPPELIGEPDLYMRDAVITEHETSGAIKYRLASDEIRHFETTRVTRLSAPKLSVHQAPDPPWAVTADYGHIRYISRRNGTLEEVVHLRDNVELQQQRDETRYITLTTEALYLYPERRYAETERPVMIDTNAGRTTAVGMQAQLGEGVLSLGTSDGMAAGEAGETQQKTERVKTIVLPSQFKADEQTPQNG